LDFALKDFYRKKKQTYPYLVSIILVIAITEFLIYFTSSLGLSLFNQPRFLNKYYFSGSINEIYEQFNTLIQILLIMLAVFIVITVTTTLIINKKKDIGIMRALGTLPRKLYHFYLLEVYIIFFLGFFLGVIFGLISFGIFNYIMNLLYYPIGFQLDLIYTPILFISCFLGIFFVTGYVLRKIGKQEIVKTFSKDIPFDYNALKKPQIIPKLLSSIGINIKISVTNTLRRKGEFRRYLIVFSLIFVILFTLGLGSFVLRTSSQDWIRKSQGENIVIFGHQDIVDNYSLMYKMFSSPNIMIDNEMINFTEPNYMFNLSDVSGIKSLEGVEGFDERLISFYDVKEIPGIHYFEEDDYLLLGNTGYQLVGKDREANIPVIGVNPNNVIQNFEIEGRFFTNEEAFDNMSIGDGLAHDLFEYALDQSLKLTAYGSTFHISGVLIDSFFCGYAGYIGLNESRAILNLTHDEINLLVLKVSHETYQDVAFVLNNLSTQLGNDFTYLKLDGIFADNLNFLSNLSLYPMFLITIIAILAILSLYNYQKSGIMEKARDFLIMRAVGSKNRSIKRILFIESMFVILPSLLLSLGIGMILNSIVLFARVSLPPLYIPFTLFGLLLVIFIFFNYLSLTPILRKIDKFSIKDFHIY
ncbi:MAG: ABC transporter permease, partial [Promethearchaeota archaeon]